MKNTDSRDIMEQAIGKYYDLETVHGHMALDYITMNPRNLRQYSLKKYKHVQLLNINGLGVGQVHFMTDDGHYLLLPWCYIVSMQPSN